jgi:hypothetical protein
VLNIYIYIVGVGLSCPVSQVSWKEDSSLPTLVRTVVNNIEYRYALCMPVHYDFTILLIPYDF